MKRYLFLLMVLGAAALLGGGWGGHDPARPDPEPTPDPVATTPDSLMALYRTAVETMDLDLYDQVLGPNFYLAVSAWEGGFDDLPTDHMTRGEVLTSAANMFGGADVTNWMGDMVPGVTRITVHQWERVTEWVGPVGKGGVEDVPPAPVVSSVWSMRMFVERGTGFPLLAVAGEYMVNAWQDTVDDGVVYRLSSMQILEETGAAAGKSETFGWAGAHLVYLTNLPPWAVFNVGESPTDPWPTFTFDPSGSSDVDSGLDPLPFRWLVVGGEPFIGEGGWSDWTADPLVFVPRQAGSHTVTLEVRDRWGKTAETERTFDVTRSWLPFPATPALLMANFQATYEDLDLDEFRRLMRPEFLTLLQQETIEQFPDVGEYLELDEELRIAERMFSGDDLTDPNGEFVPGVVGITFGKFVPLLDWQPSPPDDPIPNTLFAPYDVEILFNRGQGHSQIPVKGQIRFYVTSRDSLHEGTTTQYYQMAGQVDLTSVAKAVEEATWGSVKAMYR